MSLGDEEKHLRALANPVRLRILSLLTGASLTAAEVARELGLTHANASYHLRNLLSGGVIVVAGEEKIRGGVAKRYRYVAERDDEKLGPAGRRAAMAAFADELVRRSGDIRTSGGQAVLGDAELWIDPEKWHDLQIRIGALLHEIHEVARPPRTPGTVRTSTTVALFEMESR